MTKNVRKLSRSWSFRWLAIVKYEAGCKGPGLGSRAWSIRMEHVFIERHRSNLRMTRDCAHPPRNNDDILCLASITGRNILPLDAKSNPPTRRGDDRGANVRIFVFGNSISIQSKEICLWECFHKNHSSACVQKLFNKSQRNFIEIGKIVVCNFLVTDISTS